MTNERLTDKRALVRIVDDDEDLLQALAFMLKSEGWEVKKQVSEDRKFAPLRSESVNYSLSQST